MKDDKNDVATPCPDCGHEVYIGAIPSKGQNVTCPYCWAFLVVIDLDPLELSWDTVDLDDDDDWPVDVNGKQLQ